MRAKIGVRILVLIAIVGFILAALPVLFNENGKSGRGKEKIIEVKQGMSFYELSEILEKEKVVSSAFILRKKAEKDGIDRMLSPGRYRFFENSSYEDVLLTIKKGPIVEQVKITIPEGFTNRQVAERLSLVLKRDSREILNYLNSSKNEFVSRYPFLLEVPGNSLEGLLFPDTYYLKPQESEREAVIKMLENFEKKALEVGLISQDGKPVKGFYEKLIIASIVEKEAKVDEERPIIASVFYNRLKKGMKLQSCATVEYALGFSKPSLTNEDLKIESPYNTYLYEGLPPGPICNPGKESLNAAMNPASTDFIYFVLKDESGRHYFAETYSEFLKAKARYRR
ncbi:MAG: endolytic transglycosylase MltG [Actinobacteria bacterium]|nr:endolytic transglycosylase MltG [Actinomycetota bacterium]